MSKHPCEECGARAVDVVNGLWFCSDCATSHFDDPAADIDIYCPTW